MTLWYDRDVMRFQPAALLIVPLFAAGSLVAQEESSGVFSESSYDREGMRAAPRDAFPVLDHPTLSSVSTAATELEDSELVIGLSLGGEARAYPISVMGGIELVNDTCGEIPVAVSW